MAAAAAVPPKAAVTIHERCPIAPPADGGAEKLSLPLTFFDMVWLHFSPIQRLLFYQFPCSRSHFHETLIPNLKNSLAQTLTHYLPLAGNLIYPLNSDIRPEFRYLPGDSIPVTIAESTRPCDFNHLTCDEPRDADGFYPFVPELSHPEIDSKSGFQIIPVFAVQITLFRDVGLCIGITNHHAIGDASSIVGFIKAWSSIAMQNVVCINNVLPFYDRAVIRDPSGLAETFWSQMNVHKAISFPLNFPTNKLRATFVLTKISTQKLKNFAREKRPDLMHLSSFTIVTAYTWSCLAKSASGAGEEVDDAQTEYFGFAVDARRRLDPQVPAAYFGNCVAFGRVECTHGQLKGDDGFLAAVELISDEISKKVNNKDEILRHAGTWISGFSELVTKRVLGVAGSPRFDLYDIEFGFGKPNKYEAVSIDGPGSMSLSKSRESDGGLEIGLSLPKKKMDAFATIFNDGLKKI